MSRMKYLLVFNAMLVLSLFGQFMDPENNNPQRGLYRDPDGMFPFIIPDHSWMYGGQSKEIAILSNKVFVIERELDNTVKNDVGMMTNSTAFVDAVRIVVPGGGYPVYEFEEMKAAIAKYKNAFITITNMQISAETTLTELKQNMIIIKNAAESVLN